MTTFPSRTSRSLDEYEANAVRAARSTTSCGLGPSGSCHTSTSSRWAHADDDRGLRRLGAGSRPPLPGPLLRPLHLGSLPGVRRRRATGEARRRRCSLGSRAAVHGLSRGAQDGVRRPRTLRRRVRLRPSRSTSCRAGADEPDRAVLQPAQGPRRTAPRPPVRAPPTCRPTRRSTSPHGLGAGSPRGRGRQDDPAAHHSRTEYGGMNDALYDLYRDHRGRPGPSPSRRVLRRERRCSRHLAADEDVLDGLHANTTIPSSSAPSSATPSSPTTPPCTGADATRAVGPGHVPSGRPELLADGRRTALLHRRR